MLANLIEVISAFVLEAVTSLGMVGVFSLMALASANIPIPSEIILPFSGFLAATGVFDFWRVVLVGVAGELTGSLISYYVGTRLDGRLREKREFQSAERWYKKFGIWSVFLGRLTPIIRTFISFPAGMFRVNIWKFSLLTLLGSFLWCTILVKVGFVLGENWEIIEPYFRKFDFVVVGFMVAGFAWWVWHQRKKMLVDR